MRALGLLLLLGAALSAQERQLLQLTVTSVSGRSVYFDRGRSDGLVPGTIVRLFPPGAGPLEVEVRASSSRSARADVPPGLPMPPVGTRGEAEVEPPAPAPPSAPAPQQPAPVPWTRQEPPRDPDQPLLVPTFGQSPDERPTEVSGFLYGFTQWSRDRGGDRDADYLLARLGADLQVSNPFGRGGRLLAAGEFDARTTHVAGGLDENDAQGRFDELSYGEGDEAASPFGWETGLFYSRALPELGLVGGVEGMARFSNGARLGGGFGAYPLPFPTRDFGEDLGFHLFADVGADSDRTFAGAVGYQKTWHEGAPDRDLLLLRVEGRPGSGLWYYAAAKIDIYTSGDDLKGSGPRLTELFAQLRWDGAAVGGGLQASHFTWPDLQRQEYQDLPAALVQDGRLQRLSGDVWWRLVPDLRLRARADSWRDQDDDGTGFEFGADASDLFGAGLALQATAFATNGSDADGPGMRLRLYRRFGALGASFGWSLLRYELDDLLTGNETWTRESLLAGLDFSAGSFDLNLTAEYWFGDQEDAFAIGIYGQYRF